MEVKVSNRIPTLEMCTAYRLRTVSLLLGDVGLNIQDLNLQYYGIDSYSEAGASPARQQELEQVYYVFFSVDKQPNFRYYADL